MKNPTRVQTIFKSKEGRRRILDHYDHLLHEVDFACRETRYPTRFGETYVLESGDASYPPLVLLHGSTSNSAAWFGEIGRFARHFRVLAVDLIGDAGHSAETRPPVRSEGYALWLHDLFAAIGIPSAAIIGVSLGAWIALRFATRYPEKTDRLVLVAATGIAPVRLSFILRVLCYGISGKGAAGIIKLVFGDEPVPPAVLEYMQLLQANYKPYTGALPLFPDAALRRLTMPVFFLAGEKDALVRVPSAARRLHRLLPHAASCVLPGKGHALFNIQEHVLPFLLQTSGRTTAPPEA